jgi:plastocyanin
MQRQIDFAGIEYTPRCMRIARDQLVTFVGDFVAHPLRPGVIEMGVATEQPGGPITATSLGTETSFIFPATGTYPYYCLNHIALNMSGVIYVE